MSGSYTTKAEYESEIGAGSECKVPFKDLMVTGRKHLESGIPG
jgi:hypothetical protein